MCPALTKSIVQINISLYLTLLQNHTDISSMKRKKHGGKRKGAGRKKIYQEPTKVMRVPISLVSHVVGLIKKPCS